MRLMAAKRRLRAAEKGRKEVKLKRKVPHLFRNGVRFLKVCNDDCGILASHNFEGHVHEHHGHKTTGSPGHEEEEESRERAAEKRGNMFCCRDATAIDGLVWWKVCRFRFKSRFSSNNSQLMLVVTQLLLCNVTNS